MNIEFNIIKGKNNPIQPIFYYSECDKIMFGKYKYNYLRDIMEADKDYVIWMLKSFSHFGIAKNVWRDFDGSDFNTLNNYNVLNKLESYGEPYDIYDINFDDNDQEESEEEFETEEEHHLVPMVGTLGVNNNINNIGINIMKKVILVAYDSGKFDISKINNKNYSTYPYCTTLDLDVGDKVVVECHNGLQVCTVVKTEGLTPNQIAKACSWVVCKIDMTEHEANMAKQAKIQEIWNKVNARKEQMEGMLILKQMAKEDSTMKELLLDLGGLDSSLVPSELLENSDVKGGSN